MLYDRPPKPLSPAEKKLYQPYIEAIQEAQRFTRRNAVTTREVYWCLPHAEGGGWRNHLFAPPEVKPITRNEDYRVQRLVRKLKRAAHRDVIDGSRQTRGYEWTLRTWTIQANASTSSKIMAGTIYAQPLTTTPHTVITGIV